MWLSQAHGMPITPTTEPSPAYAPHQELFSLHKNNRIAAFVLVGLHFLSSIDKAKANKHQTP